MQTEEKAVTDGLRPEMETSLMGTDELRRDLTIGIVWGTPVALFIGLTVSIASIFIGLIYGFPTGLMIALTGLTFAFMGRAVESRADTSDWRARYIAALSSYHVNEF
jgi:ABC-type dipeptide/oligopeptide/nickel transport system permease subunit